LIPRQANPADEPLTLREADRAALHYRTLEALIRAIVREELATATLVPQGTGADGVWLNLTQAAQRAGISRTTITAALANGTLPFSRVSDGPRGRRIRTDDLDTWLIRMATKESNHAHPDDSLVG
jgi:excisionase family DNA binding protein